MRKQAVPTLLTAGLAATALLASSQALAYSEGDFITRVGVAHVDPKSNNGTLDGGIDVDVRSDTNLGFTLGYLFHDNFGVELLAALPFKHDIRLADGAIDASTKHLPPTLTVQYYPLGGSGAQVQPYAGIGLNYTNFFSEEIDLPNVDLDLSSSWGLAGQLGMDVRLDDNWGLNVAAWYIDIDSDVKLNGEKVGKTSIDPWVFMAGISYRF
ncbi:OmpW/AlkL family protein [Billgrantia kenyensis]|uniref:Outer membrane beta-barrel protein n=1 Tax=Billgrantia kenyensis TaxID=321266 RepID=A0A7V9W2S1_9GAMM|nr:OmpW family outer membrane protein [Halomonas kenyensis]MBA2780002.1 outer membrane beta-barrel protein [Halomonas kenyensis]MCG6662983.1 outer membrane beta-barrel protein [Halomonas kenyensis]